MWLWLLVSFPFFKDLDNAFPCWLPEFGPKCTKLTQRLRHDITSKNTIEFKHAVRREHVFELRFNVCLKFGEDMFASLTSFIKYIFFKVMRDQWTCKSVPA